MGSTLRSAQASLEYMAPVRSHVDGTAVVFGAGHSMLPQHNSQDVLSYKAVYLNSTGTPGLMAVHLTNDPAGAWFLVDLTNGVFNPTFEFDLIGDSTLGSTIAFDNKLQLFPAIYKNGESA